jgi:hypothetical protein
MESEMEGKVFDVWRIYWWYPHPRIAGAVWASTARITDQAEKDRLVQALEDTFAQYKVCHAVGVPKQTV